MYNLDINWVIKCIFFYRLECREYLFFLLGSLTVLPSGPEPTVAPPEVITGEPLNHIMEFLGPIKFLNPLNFLILYFIKNIPLGDFITSLVLPGLLYVTLMITKFDKTPAQIPLYYYDFLDVFREIKANTLPLYWPYVDHAINLIPG